MRMEGVPDACDVCHSTVKVAPVVHREMVANRPYVRDLCARCAKEAMLAYVRNGGAPIYARRG